RRARGRADGRRAPGRAALRVPHQWPAWPLRAPRPRARGAALRLAPPPPGRPGADRHRLRALRRRGRVGRVRSSRRGSRVRALRAPGGGRRGELGRDPGRTRGRDGARGPRGHASARGAGQAAATARVALASTDRARQLPRPRAEQPHLSPARLGGADARRRASAGVSPALVALAAGYLLGALPTAYLVAKARGVNVFAVGSGSMGAMNTARNLGVGAGLLVLAVDVGKGALATYLGTLMAGIESGGGDA